LVFDHTIVHEGLPLLSGDKWLLRSEIVFERVFLPETVPGLHIIWVSPGKTGSNDTESSKDVELSLLVRYPHLPPLLLPPPPSPPPSTRHHLTHSICVLFILFILICATSVCSTYVHRPDGTRGELLWSNRPDTQTRSAAQWSLPISFRPGDPDLPAAWSLAARRHNFLQPGHRAMVVATAAENSYGVGQFPGWGVPSSAVLSFDMEIIDSHRCGNTPTPTCASTASSSPTPLVAEENDRVLFEEVQQVAQHFPAELTARYVSSAQQLASIRTIVMDGSFNPPHVGYLRALRAVFEAVASPIKVLILVSESGRHGFCNTTVVAVWKLFLTAFGPQADITVRDIASAGVRIQDELKERGISCEGTSLLLGEDYLKKPLLLQRGLLRLLPDGVKVRGMLSHKDFQYNICLSILLLLLLLLLFFNSTLSQS
jgi:hypothetical protein